MTTKLTYAEVERLACSACVDTDVFSCTSVDPCPAHRLLAHIEAQEQELTDLRTEMRVLRGEMENHRKAYWAYEPRPQASQPTQ